MVVEPEPEVSSVPEVPKGPSISLSINNVVGNYKPIKPKTEVVVAAAATTTTTTTTTAKSTPKATVKPNSKPAVKLPPPKPLPKSNPKVNLNKTPAPPQKTTTTTAVPPSKTVTKSSLQHRATDQDDDDDEEDLDPSIYLDPTITITLVNNEPDNKKSIGKSSCSNDGAMSSSDLQVNSLF